MNEGKYLAFLPPEAFSAYSLRPKNTGSNKFTQRGRLHLEGIEIHSME
jgi:hypothetical protein